MRSPARGQGRRERLPSGSVGRAGTLRPAGFWESCGSPASPAGKGTGLGPFTCATGQRGLPLGSDGPGPQFPPRPAENLGKLRSLPCLSLPPFRRPGWGLSGDQSVACWTPAPRLQVAPGGVSSDSPRPASGPRKVPRAGLAPRGDGHSAACGGPIGGAGFRTIWGEMKNLSRDSAAPACVQRGKKVRKSTQACRACLGATTEMRPGPAEHCSDCWRGSGLH